MSPYILQAELVSLKASVLPSCMLDTKRSALRFSYENEHEASCRGPRTKSFRDPFCAERRNPCTVAAKRSRLRIVRRSDKAPHGGRGRTVPVSTVVVPVLWIGAEGSVCEE